MKTKPRLFLLPLLLALSACKGVAADAPATASAAEAPAQPPAKKGALLFSDDFERAEIGPAWRTSQRSFAIVDGALKAGQMRSEHPAVGAVSVPFKDAIIEFRFRFEGASGISAVCDDKAFTGSHAGHICRVTITPKLIRLGDDREGGMRNDILELRKDPKRRAEGDKLMEGRTKAFPAMIEAHGWHLLKMEIVGEEMRVSLDEKFVGGLKSPGIGHPTKSTFHFSVSGKDVLLDDLHIWAAEPAQK